MTFPQSPLRKDGRYKNPTILPLVGEACTQLAATKNFTGIISFLNIKQKTYEFMFVILSLFLQTHTIYRKNSFHNQESNTMILLECVICEQNMHHQLSFTNS